jgi:iron-sulfur cluster repair protein YtfE (RIC family)
MRERQICAEIDRLVSSVSFDRPAAHSVLRFLNEELNVHMRDEAEDLFPLLAKRCPTEDGIGRAITRVRSDLDAATRLLPEVRATLARCLDAGSDLTVENGEMLMRFVGHVRRHLAAENAILLPIARARLTQHDLETLSHRMRSRRRLPPASETTDAE